MKVVVMGAGVLGASTALALTNAGAEVTLVETDRPGSGTSSRGAGLVSEAMWHPTSLRLVRRSIELLQAMSREGEALGHPLRFHHTGSTTLVPPDLVPSARALARLQARLGVRVRELVGEDIHGLPRHDGMRVDDVAVALHYPDDGWALPRMYAEVCSFLAQQRGARLLQGPTRIVRSPTGVGVEANGDRVGADAVVVACGVWTREALRPAGLDAPLQAYRTQALRFKERRAEHLPILHDGIQGFYLRPGIPAHCVAGNGTTTTPEDLTRWKEEADESFVVSTRRRLLHRFPFLPAEAQVESWAGIDAATPDRLLLAGPHPADDRIWLLAGGNGHGFMRAPATGEAMAALLLGKAPPVDIAAFAPARFETMDAPFAIREGFSLADPVPEEPEFK